MPGAGVPTVLFIRFRKNPVDPWAQCPLICFGESLRRGRGFGMDGSVNVYHGVTRGAPFSIPGYQKMPSSTSTIISRGGNGLTISGASGKKLRSAGKKFPRKQQSPDTVGTLFLAIEQTGKTLALQVPTRQTVL